MNPSRFLLSAWLSYRALFTWLNPWGYVSSRVLLPVTLALLFGAIGRYTGGSVLRPVVGAAMLAVAAASVYGMNLAMANERVFGTLGLVLATPQSMLASLFAKALLHLVDALVGAAITLGAAMLVFSLQVPASAYPALLACTACAALSTMGLGIAVASASVRFRDVFTVPNITDAVLLVTSGAVVATSALPAGLRQVGEVLPLTRAVRAAQVAAEGGPLRWSLLGVELLVGLAWGVVGYALLRWMVLQSRRNASYDLL